MCAHTGFRTQRSSTHKTATKEMWREQNEKKKKKMMRFGFVGNRKYSKVQKETENHERRRPRERKKKEKNKWDTYKTLQNKCAPRISQKHGYISINNKYYMGLKRQYFKRKQLTNKWNRCNNNNDDDRIKKKIKHTVKQSNKTKYTHSLTHTFKRAQKKE